MPSVGASLHPPAVGASLQPLVEAVRGSVEGDQLVRGSVLRTDHVAPRLAGQLHPDGLVGESRIALLGDLHVYALKDEPVVLEPFEPLAYVVAEPLGHLDLPTSDDNIHRSS